MTSLLLEKELRADRQDGSLVMLYISIVGRILLNNQPVVNSQAILRIELRTQLYRVVDLIGIALADMMMDSLDSFLVLLLRSQPLPSRWHPHFLIGQGNGSLLGLIVDSKVEEVFFLERSGMNLELFLEGWRCFIADIADSIVSFLLPALNLCQKFLHLVKTASL